MGARPEARLLNAFPAHESAREEIGDPKTIPEDGGPKQNPHPWNQKNKKQWDRHQERTATVPQRMKRILNTALKGAGFKLLLKDVAVNTCSKSIEKEPAEGFIEYGKK